MASFSMKSVLFLLIVAHCVCSAFSLSGASAWGKMLGKGAGLPKQLSRTTPDLLRDTSIYHNPENVIPRNPQHFIPRNLNPQNLIPRQYFPQKPELQHSLPNEVGTPALNKFVKEQAKRYGSFLANKFFGPDGEKGFRWGLKMGKRYISVAKRC